jgi:hypothetical protein
MEWGTSKISGCGGIPEEWATCCFHASWSVFSQFCIHQIGRSRCVFLRTWASLLFCALTHVHLALRLIYVLPTGSRRPRKLDLKELFIHILRASQCELCRRSFLAEPLLDRCGEVKQSNCVDDACKRAEQEGGRKEGRKGRREEGRKGGGLLAGFCWMHGGKVRLHAVPHRDPMHRCTLVYRYVRARRHASPQLLSSDKSWLISRRCGQTDAADAADAEPGQTRSRGGVQGKQWQCH